MNQKDKLLDLPEFQSLSPEERELALQILNEYKNNGSSEIFNNLRYGDYKEIPVDIETFLKDEQYLGNAWRDAEGNFRLYPFWLDVLKEIFPNNIDTDYDTLLESGARGIGKSENACGCVAAYMMYRVMCLKDPLEYYHLKNTEKIAFAFMNIKLDLAEAIATSKFQKTIQASPWFMSRGMLTKRDNKPYWIPPDPIEIIIGSQSDDVIGRPIMFAFFDEISFLKNKNVEEQKKKAKDMIDTAKGGMKTRFIYKGKNPTMLVVASSKRSEQSFMETYIRDLAEVAGEHTYIVDKPVWEVKPKGTFMDETFYVGLGGKFLDNIVIPRADYANLEAYRLKGYTLLEMPVDFESDALMDLERVLCDYAGISSFSSNKFLSAERVVDVISDEFVNPLPDIIKCGNGKEDLTQYYQYFKFENVQKQYMSKPLFIHLDLSLSGDKTGIAGVWITGKKPTSDGNPGKDLQFQVAFSTSIEAPKGQKISLAKNREFIRWLKNKGFRIRTITYDTYQSADTGQQLSAEGFDCDTLSVDRTELTDDKIAICRPYEYLKHAIYEGRLKLYKTDLLFNELVQLEKDYTSGKIDHPPKGSKDQSDAVCGAVYTASKHAEEYAFDYGEDLESFVELNTDNELEQSQKQLIVDFEQELLRTFDPLKMNSTKQQATQGLYSIEQPKEVMSMYFADGIIL